MIYLLIGILLLFVLFSLIKKGRNLKRVLHIGSVVTVMIFVLKRPAALLNLLNILFPLLFRAVNSSAYDEKIASKKAENVLTKEEAREILGVKENADEQEIKAAFKKLMIKNHPDQGGSNYIANRLVKARNKLLGM